MPRTLSRRTALAAAASLPAAGLLPSILRAEAAWKPTQGVRIVVPAAPGGTTDIVARLLAAFLQQAWGQSCVVDNKSGAGGVIGSTEVVKSAPDGHTVLMGNIGPQSIAYSLYRNMPYTPASLIPVSAVITAPNVLVIHPSVPAKTVPEFVAWLKAENGKVSYASSGTGQSPHLSGAWFLQLTGTKAEHIPYRGAAPALQDLTAGVTQFFFDNLTTSIEFVRAGKLRALGITSAARNPLTPELVPICETVPELKPFDVSTWFGVFLPAHTAADRRFVQCPDEGLAGRSQDQGTLHDHGRLPRLRHARAVRRIREGADRAVEGRDRQGRAEARRQLKFCAAWLGSSGFSTAWKYWSRKLWSPVEGRPTFRSGETEGFRD
ncbi:MAG TPA: tripartite tricarboxylate transporter substrate binding protein, partial [Reyranella sp.]|nr:tripartite tricarboxylate transporter substrate binding protein [Reyranella sp.]